MPPPVGLPPGAKLLSLISANATSLSTAAEGFLSEATFDLAFVQEHRQGARACKLATRRMARQGIHAVFRPAPLKIAAAAGGVAILAKQHLNVKPFDATFPEDRFVAAALPL